MRGRRIMGAALAAVMGAGLLAATATTAAAVELSGAWAPLNRCPVDDPAMVAADGRTVSASCLTSSSASGSIKLGGTTVTTGGTNLQLGVLTSGGQQSVLAPSGGALVSAPVKIPGGLLGLACPDHYIPGISEICAGITNNELNNVYAIVEPAGAPSEFSLTAGLVAGEPILRLPVKIRLQNPLLGNNCYIGTNANPIVLRPENVTRPARTIVRFNPDGTANPTGTMGYAVSSGTDQIDNTFAVPGASGCGLGLGLLNTAVNLKQGLPSASGNNSIVLTNSTTYYGGIFNPAAFQPNQGQQLRDLWHAAAN